MSMQKLSDPSAKQLDNYKENHPKIATATSSAGKPLACLDSTISVGRKGFLLLANANFFEEISHSARERIPERVICGKGAGAFGIFEVTHDITEYTAAKVFKNVKQKTPIAVRFSKMNGECGSADTVRTERGLAIKFYTEDGIWDLVAQNFPVAPLREPALMASLCHAHRRNPVTQLIDNDMWWDFVTLNPQTAHSIVMYYSDRGITKGFRHMNGYGVNTYSLINESGVMHYCKFHLHTEQGIANFCADEAKDMVGKDPDYAIRDMYDAIAKGNHPSWHLYIQVMTQEQAKTHQFDPFDPTKVWYRKDYPLKPVGKLVLNRNPTNYFAEVEQIAFNPGNLIPGIGTSPDITLQCRMFAYSDAQRYRLRVNYNQLPVNTPFKVCNYMRDGISVINNQNGAPTCHPNSFNGPRLSKRASQLATSFEVSGGKTACYELDNEDNFTQAGKLYREVMKEEEKTRLVNNIAVDLKKVNELIQARGVAYFSQVDEELGRNLGAILFTSVSLYADL